MRDIDKLVPHPKNRNKHPAEQIDRLIKIIEFQGWRRPIRISTLSGYITAGHGALSAAKKAGWTQVPVDLQAYADSDAEYADMVADNSLAAWGELDLAGINADLPDLHLPDIDLLGIKDFVVDMSEKNENDPDAVPEPPKDAKVKTGELWLLGNHRLLCGDCTVNENVERLMAGEKADMVFTDPPYGISIVSSASNSGGAKAMTGSIGQDGQNRILKPRQYRKVKNDESPETAFQAIKNFPECSWLIWGGNFFAHRLPQSTHWIVWNKNAIDDAGEGAFFSDAELAWTNFSNTSVKMYRFGWTGLFRSGPRNEELVKRVHPTQKPVGLFSKILEDYTEIENAVLDPFLGSGSTLIACEKTNRRCFGMEIDPTYCDVIIERWQKYSGKEAVREDGVKYSEL